MLTIKGKLISKRELPNKYNVSNFRLVEFIIEKNRKGIGKYLIPLFAKGVNAEKVLNFPLKSNVCVEFWISSTENMGRFYPKINVLDVDLYVKKEKQRTEIAQEIIKSNKPIDLFKDGNTK